MEQTMASAALQEWRDAEDTDTLDTYALGGLHFTGQVDTDDVQAFTDLTTGAGRWFFFEDGSVLHRLPQGGCEVLTSHASDGVHDATFQNGAWHVTGTVYTAVDLVDEDGHIAASLTLKALHDYTEGTTDVYYQHPLTGDWCEHLGQAFNGWSEQDPKDQRAWDILAAVLSDFDESTAVADAIESETRTVYLDYRVYDALYPADDEQ